jgi:anti-anti-sigma factor
MSVTGELDLATVESLFWRLDSAAARALPRVVLDLSGVSFMDCAAVAAVVKLADRARAAGMSLQVIPPAPAVARIVTMGGAGGAGSFPWDEPRVEPQS